MSKSVNMERLIQNLDNRLQNNLVNTNKEEYLPLNKDITPDSNFSFINKQNIKNIPAEPINKIKVQNQTIVDKKVNYLSICKRYFLIFLIFIILSHQEFDYITNIDNMPNLYRIVLKALVFVIILMILNTFVK